MGSSSVSLAEAVLRYLSLTILYVPVRTMPVTAPRVADFRRMIGRQQNIRPKVMEPAAVPPMAIPITAGTVTFGLVVGWTSSGIVYL